MTLRPLRTWPHWLAPLIASLIAAIVFHALGHNPFTHLYGAGDGYITGLPSKIFSASLSAWNPWVQLGHYTFHDTQYQPFYLPGLIVMRLLPNTFGYNLFILAHYAAAGLFGYLYFRNLGLGRFAATFGGLCFELSGFLSAHKGHTAIISAAIWLPLMLLAVDRFFDTRRIRHLAVGAIATAMSFFGGFAQITLYAMMLTAAYACWRAATTKNTGWQERFRLLAWAGAIVAGLGLLIAAIQVVPVVASLPQLTRERLTYEMFSQDALPLYFALTFIVPNLFGGLYDVLNYSTNINFVELFPYMGLLPIALATGVAFASASTFRDLRFWVAATVVAVFLALGPGTLLHPVLFHVPVYNLFRNAARHLLEINFAICVLAAVAMDAIVSSDKVQLRRQIFRGAGATLAGCFVAGIAAVLLVRSMAGYVETREGAGLRPAQLNALATFGQGAQVATQNLSAADRTTVLPLSFMMLSAGALIWLARSPHSRAARIALVTVIAADLYTVNGAIYTYPDTRPAFHPETREEMAVLKSHGYDATRDRIYPLEEGLHYVFPVRNLLSGVSVINDYGPMWSKRYQYVSSFYNNGIQLPERVADVRFLSITSTKFVLTRSADARGRLLANSPPPGALPVATRDIPASDFRLLDADAIDEGFRLRRATGAVSMAFLPVALQPNTFYAVKFEARALSGHSNELVVDLYGRNYDSASQDRVLVKLPVEFEEQTLQIDAGPAPAADAKLRIFTQSVSPIDIRRVRVVTMPPAAPSPFREVAVTADGIHVFENTQSLPRFRFATDLRPAADLVTAKRVLESPGFDFARSAAVEGLPAAETVDAGAILSQSLDNTSMRWQLRTGARSFFVVGDLFFPGWTATVDGKPARIYAVDGFLRGVFVEGPGEHDVRMEFRPEKFWLGVMATVVGLVALAIVWFRG